MNGITYLDLGFNDNFQKGGRQSVNEPVQQITTQEASTLFQGIPADRVIGGRLQSVNGKLVIDLDQGSMVYNDGVVDLLNVGGDENNLTITDSDNINVLST